MMVPMATAVIMALLTNKAMTAIKRTMLKLASAQKRRCARIPDAENHHEEGLFHLDKHTLHACFVCFRAALLINTCLTMAVASWVPSNHELIFQVSMYGILLAVIVCLGIWSWLSFHA